MQSEWCMTKELYSEASVVIGPTAEIDTQVARTWARQWFRDESTQTEWPAEKGKQDEAKSDQKNDSDGEDNRYWEDGPELQLVIGDQNFVCTADECLKDIVWTTDRNVRVVQQDSRSEALEYTKHIFERRTGRRLVYADKLVQTDVEESEEREEGTAKMAELARFDVQRILSVEVVAENPPSSFSRTHSSTRGGWSLFPTK